MAQSKRQIQQFLSEAGGEPRKRFGQNFMIDQNLVRLVADAGMLQPGELVVEVGPGTGTLTEELLDRGVRVLAVEIDRDLARLLQTRWVAERRFHLIEADVLAGKHGLNADLARTIREELASGGGVKLVANLPYNIASPLVIELLIAGVGLMAFTVQKEVARRLVAGVGDEEYGGLSVMAQLLSRVEVLRVMPASAFWPAPKVESALVRMARRDRLRDRAAAFGRFVQGVFAYRRKTMRKALEQAGYPADALRTVGIDPGHRPEQVTPEEFLRLFEAAQGGP